MSNLLAIIICGVLVNNYVLSQFLGICPFLGVSKKLDQAAGMGVAVTFVMLLATAATWPIQTFVLDRFGLGYLQTIVFILVIAALVQFVEIVLKKFLPALHRSLGVYLPLITTNCAVLGVTVNNISDHYGFVESLVSAFGCGAGFLLAMVLFAGVRSRMENCTGIPKAFKGIPITLVAASVVAMAFKGFENMWTIEKKEAVAEQGKELGFAAGIASAVATMVTVGLLCALLLVVASRYFAVKTDEKVEKIRECLPGANCGACGYTGCDGYAKALAEGKDVPTNLCVPGADAVSKSISGILGVQFQDVVEKVAFVHCRGYCTKTEKKFVYEGIESCKAVKLLYGGDNSCVYGCLGYGDCVKACPQKAIYIKNGIARVTFENCVGCGLCAKACPNHVISLFPDVADVAVNCSNKEKGVVARKNCTNACIGCGKCARSCEMGAISIVDNLAVIDYNKCNNCGVCVTECPFHVLKLANYSGRHKKSNQ